LSRTSESWSVADSSRSCKGSWQPRWRRRSSAKRKPGSVRRRRRIGRSNAFDVRLKKRTKESFGRRRSMRRRRHLVLAMWIQKRGRPQRVAQLEPGSDSVTSLGVSPTPADSEKPGIGSGTRATAGPGGSAPNILETVRLLQAENSASGSRRCHPTQAQQIQPELGPVLARRPHEGKATETGETVEKAEKGEKSSAFRALWSSRGCWQARCSDKSWS